VVYDQNTWLSKLQIESAYRSNKQVRKENHEESDAVEVFNGGISVTDMPGKLMPKVGARLTGRTVAELQRTEHDLQ